jgi:hypothetical protein
VVSATDESSSNVRKRTSGGVSLVLPASWWVLDVRDERSRRRSVAALVEQQTGRDDRLASLRADLRRSLEESAVQAAALDGVLLAVSLMQVGLLPLPASLTVYRQATGVDAGADALRALHDVLVADPQGFDTLDLAEGSLGLVLRRTALSTGPRSLGAQDLPVLVVDYWLDPSDGRGLLTLTFSSPLTGMRDGLLDLFDAVVGSVTVTATAHDLQGEM